MFVAAALSSCSNKNDLSGECTKLDLKTCYVHSEELTPIIVKDFGIFLRDSSGAQYYEYTDPVHVTFNENWIYSTIKIGKQSCWLYAFYPYRDMTFPYLPIDLQTQIDYLYCEPLIFNYSNAAISIEMKHLLTKLTFVVNGNASIKVNASEVPTTGSFNLVKKSFDLQIGNIKSEANTILLAPGKLEGYRLKIFYQGKNYDYLLPYIQAESGCEYVYRLTINKSNELELSNIHITDWGYGNEYTGTLK